MNTKVIIGGIVVVVLIIGAMYFMSKSSTPAPAATQQQTQPASAAAASTTSPQVQGQDVAVGTGAQAAPGDTVAVLYVGKLSDGTVFDSSAAHNNQPLTFDLGTTSLMAGFQIGINGMKVGGERLLSIPAELGYGAQDVKDANGKVIIPANSTLVFDVKLVSVTPAKTPATH